MFKKILGLSVLGYGAFLAYKNMDKIKNFTNDMYSKMMNTMEDMKDQM